jgi:hypothetical protein
MHSKIAAGRANCFYSSGLAMGQARGSDKESNMFGKPQWFRPKTLGWGLIPVSWQGWIYTVGWAAGIGLPFLLLLGQEKALEAMGWMGFAIGLLTYDVWQILRTFRSPQAAPARGSAKNDDNVLYILDSRPGDAVATRNYNLQLRR